MNLSTIKLVVNEMWTGPDSAVNIAAMKRVISNINDLSDSDVKERCLEFMFKRSLIGLTDKEEFERRLLLREAEIRQGNGVTMNHPL